MLSINPFRIRLPIIELTLGAIAAIAFSISAQEAPAIHVGNEQLKGLPEDWTHHHLVFHDPGSADDAMLKGHYDEWFTIVNNPRYVMQQMKQERRVQGGATDDVDRYEEDRRDARRGARERDRWRHDRHKTRDSALTGDWSMALGGSGTKVGAGVFPAKYNFSTTAAVNCASASNPDFVVYNTSVAGSATQASIVAYDNLYSGCSGQIPSVYWAFNTAGTVVTSAVLSYTGTEVFFVQTPSSGNAQLVLLKWAKTPTGRNVTSGVTNITSGSKNFTATAGLTAMDVGALISGTGIPAGDTIATITSATAGTLTNAAIGNGTNGESLSISADAGAPNTLTSVSNALYFGCTAPCMTTLSFSGTTRNDTISSPYYDYDHDTLYVGDSAGGLHKFTPVFSGTPAEVLTGGNPWASLGTTAVTSPVFDSTSGKVFAGDASGFVYSVNSSGTVVKSFQLAVSPGIVDGPMIDSTNGQLYVTVSNDLNASNTATVSTCLSGTSKGPCNAIINLPTSFTASTAFFESVIGAGTANTLYDGAFDNLYWNTGTGNLYTVGGTGANFPKLMETPVTTAGFTTSIACVNSTGSLPNCPNANLRCANNVDNAMTSAAVAGSPVTEFLNGAVDRIYASVSGSATLPPTGCIGACVESWTVTTALTGGAQTGAVVGATEAGGTSGIIVDNSDAGGGSQVYFSTLSNGTCATSGSVGAASTGCAIQASQSGLN